MAKKQYYIPTIEVFSVRTNEMMWALGGSPDHGQPAGLPPKRLEKAF